MKLEIYQIDAFTDKVFGGNPACVVPLDEWLPNATLKNIAKENAVAETAFYIDHEDYFHLRWFTPEIEMDLCGHATLAAAHCIMQTQNYQQDRINFQTLSGKLSVEKKHEFYLLDFPARDPEKADLPEVILNALNIQPKQVLKSRDYVLIYDTEEEIRKIKINRLILDQINLDPGGIVVTAKGEQCDFVSRFFTPQASILEDPVTGSSHCSLIPYWSEILQRKDMVAMQLSERKGFLKCAMREDRVVIGGQAVIYSKGHLWI